MRAADLGAFAMGNVISAAIIWSCGNCGDPANPQPEDVGVMLEREREHRRIHKAGYPARRTAAQLTPDAYDMLATIALGSRSRMAVIDSCLEFFFRECGAKREAVEACIMRRPVGRRGIEPTAPIPVLFTNDVVQQLRGVSAATGLSVPAVISDIVTRALITAGGGA